MVRIISGLEGGPGRGARSAVEILRRCRVERRHGTERARRKEPDAFDEQVRGKLDASRQSSPAAPGPVPASAGPQANAASRRCHPAGPQGGQMPPGMPNLSPEQQKQMEEGMRKMQEVMKNLSEEEKERLKTMSMEERMEFFKEDGGRRAEVTSSRCRA